MLPRARAAARDAPARHAQVCAQVWRAAAARGGLLCAQGCCRGSAARAGARRAGARRACRFAACCRLRVRRPLPAAPGNPRPTCLAPPAHPAPPARSTLWRYLFGRQAKDLEQSNTAEDEYMIGDTDLWVTKYVSVPREMGHLNPAAFVAGIVRGVLDGGGFPARCVPARCWGWGWGRGQRGWRRRAAGWLPSCPGGCLGAEQGAGLAWRGLREGRRPAPAARLGRPPLPRSTPPPCPAPALPRAQRDGALRAGAGPGAAQDSAAHEVPELRGHPGAGGAPGRLLTPPPRHAPCLRCRRRAAGSRRARRLQRLRAASGHCIFFSVPFLLAPPLLLLLLSGPLLRAACCPPCCSPDRPSRDLFSNTDLPF